MVRPKKRLIKNRAKPRLYSPVSDPTCVDEKNCAKRAGISVLAMRLLLAAGTIQTGHFEEYLEDVDTLAAVGQAFGVSERTAASWKAKGMPVSSNGKYQVAAIRYWRLQQPDPPDWLFRGSKDLAPAVATGDLARAILRWLRTEILPAASLAREDFMTVLVDVDRSDDEAIGELFSAAIARHFTGFRLTDEEIEKLLVDAWRLV